MYHNMLRLLDSVLKIGSLAASSPFPPTHHRGHALFELTHTAPTLLILSPLLLPIAAAAAAAPPPTRSCSSPPFFLLLISLPISPRFIT